MARLFPYLKLITDSFPLTPDCRPEASFARREDLINKLKLTLSRLETGNSSGLLLPYLKLKTGPSLCHISNKWYIIINVAGY
jgi:hypothetical protein